MASSVQKIFGAGFVSMTPVGVTNPTPLRVITLKEVSVEFSSTTKELRGSTRFAEDVANGPAKISGKAKFGRVHGGVLQAFMPGGTISTGRIIVVDDERATIPSTPFIVTVANGANFDTDLGVYDLTTGKMMDRVASAPATGQYSLNVATGVYTFAAADTTHQVSFRYLYKNTTVGTTFNYVNQQMGVSQKYEVTVFNKYDGQDVGIRLYACVIPKLSLPFKSEDYVETDMDFEACQDTLGRVFELYQS